MSAFYCAVCRQTFFSGKKHIFGKSHQSKLKVVLVKFLEKVKEARRKIKSPQVEKFDCTQHECKFWCYCCSLEVQKHVSNGNITVLSGGLLEHMATPQHKKNTNTFWWENKADPRLKEKFLFTLEEIERFKTEVAKAVDSFEEKEDVLIKEQAAYIRAQEQHRQEVLQSLFEPEPERNPSDGPSQCASDDTEARTLWMMEMFTLVLSRPGYWTTPWKVARKRWGERSARLYKTSLNRRSRRSCGSFRRTASGPISTTAPRRTPAGCPRSAGCGTAAGGGSPDTSSERRKARRAGRRGGRIAGGKGPRDDAHRTSRDSLTSALQGALVHILLFSNACGGALWSRKDNWTRDTCVVKRFWIW